MEYSIFLGKSILNIDENTYINLKNGNNNNYEEFNIYSKLFNYIKDNMLENVEEKMSFIKFSTNNNYIILKYNNNDEFKEIYNILVVLYDEYYNNKKQSFINSLSEKDFNLRKRFNDLGKDYFKEEFDVYISNIFNKNIVTYQKNTELGNIITIKDNSTYTENLKIFLEDENGLHFFISFSYSFDYFRNLEIGYFERGFNSYIRINKDGSIEIDNNLSIIGKKLYIKKNIYHNVDDYDKFNTKKHPINYGTDLLEYSIEKRKKGMIKEDKLIIYNNLFEAFLYKGIEDGIEIYELLMKNDQGGNHGFEIKLFIKDGNIIKAPGRRLESGEYKKLFNSKYIHYYYN